MPVAIARVMNMPDGSTPTPPLGGGDVNGTLAASILNHQAGTGWEQVELVRHLVHNTSAMGIPGAVVAQQLIPVVGASTLGGNE